MEISARKVLRLILFTLVVLLAPMIAFPESFGLQLAKGSLVNALYELVYYGFVVFLMQRRGGLLQLLPAAGLCLVYRLIVGAVFGLLVSAVYGMSAQVSVTLGLSSYLPAVWFQTLLAPFIMKPIVDEIYKLMAPPRAVRPRRAASTSEEGRTSLVISPERGFVRDQIPARPAVVEATPVVLESPPEPPVHRETAGPVPMNELNGFERAVRYVGEHGAVHLAAVVDAEGLSMANFRRGEIDSEDWAPLALLFSQENNRLLRRWCFDGLDKLNLATANHRITVATVSDWHLMVIASRDADDVLKIRTTQAMEIIRKYVDERFGSQPSANAERIHVSSAE